MQRYSLKLLLCVLLLAPVARGLAQISLVSTGAVWKYLDDGTDQNTAWRSPAFVDSGWASGPAQLGYGDGGEATTNSFGPDANNKYVTTYYRHSFNVANAASITNLLLRLLRDDGGVVYLNGTEVFRDNMPAGPIAFSTYASATVEDAFVIGNPSPALLVNGANLLAVEIHQSTTNTSDLSFDLELTGNYIPVAPTVALLTPTNTQAIASSVVIIQASAADSDGSVTNVEFFANGGKIGEDTSAPYSFSWVGVTPGAHALYVRATDNSGMSATSPTITVQVSAPTQPGPILREGIWKYFAGPATSAPGPEWINIQYNDATWPSGPAELGYGDGDEATVVPFGSDPNNKWITTYFRKSFVVNDPSLYMGALNLSLEYDDGAIVYLNGTELFRAGMPAGAVTWSTVGTAAIEDTIYETTISPSLLLPGVNVFAVEVHQSGGTSSDISFALELRGLISPRVSIVSPTNGQTFTAPLNFDIVADATDPDGAITRVDFYDDATVIGSATNAPFRLTVTSLPEGQRTLVAAATDNSGVTTNSAPVTITVIDPSPPTIIGANANTNRVSVTFSKALVQPSATTPANYTISPPIGIAAAQYGSSSNVIVLTTSSLLSPGVPYTLTVNNVRDRAGNSIAPNSQVGFEVVGYEHQDIGNPAIAGSFTPVTGGFNYSGGGTNLGGTSDQFAFAHSERTGDFDLQVRLGELAGADVWSKAGLMARETLAANSRHASSVATPGLAGAFFQFRSTAGGNTTNSGSFPVNFPNTYLRLSRVGSVFTGYGSWDGEAWTRLGSVTLNGAPQTMYVGLLLVSSSTQPVTAQFRDVVEASGGTFGAFKAPIEPPGPSTRRTGLVITEIMYKPAPREDGKVLDFVEVYNSNPYWEDISGYRISGDVDYVFPQGTVMPGGSYVVIAKNPQDLQSEFPYLQNVHGPYTNNLPTAGTVRLRSDQNAIYLEVPYSNDPPWPVGADGTGHSLVLARPSYGERNPEAWSISDRVGGSPGKQDGYTAGPLRNVLINEFVANSAEPIEDYIELYNHSNVSVDISGCTLSDDKNEPKLIIPLGTSIPARGFVVFQQSQLNFGLNSGGEAMYFKSPDGRVLDVIKFEAQAVNVASGRYPDGGDEVYPLKTRTPGAANGEILVHNIVINEIMYQPVTGDSDEEFVELFNMGTNAVDLSGWQFISGISFTFPSNTVLQSSNYLVVARNSARLLSNYPNLNLGNTVGNYDGSLNNSGERLALAMPDVAYTTNLLGEVSTNIVYVVVDEVTYGIGGHWGEWHKEGGSSLELVDPRANHRLAYNWTDSDETSKAPWTTVSATGAMEQGSGAANLIEILTMDEGEYLVDDVEVLNSSQANMIAAANSTLDSGIGNWFGRGTHDKSTWDADRGFGDSGCLHLRATARGDTIANRAVCTITPPTGVVTLRAKVRWLKGWPEILLRLHGNHFEAFGRLQLPKNLGTPGARNSKALNNAGPAIADVVHGPVLPGANEPAIVTARIADPDGLGPATLFYRIDPSSSYANVAMLDNGTGGDAIAGDGIFSGTIPGQSANTLVAFYVQATDSRGASTTLPRDASPTSKECLVRFGEPYITSSFGTYRQWFTELGVNTWINRPALSNQRIFGTFIYGNVRVIYNHGAKYSSSPYHQGQHSSPVTGSVHYAIELPLDDQCLGTDNWNKVHAPGNSAFDENTNQREQIGYWFARKMGLPWNYRRYVNMFVNGVKKGTGAQIMEDTERGGDDFVDSRFPDDNNGNLFKMQPWFEVDDGHVTGTTALGFANVNWCTLNRYTPATNSAVNFTPRYRQNWLVRAADQTANDFSAVYSLVDAANTSTNGWAAHAAALENVADMENWMRIFSVHHSVGDWDHFGSQNAQNMYGYKPRNGKWTLMIWDFNILMGNSGSWGPGLNLFVVNAGDSRMPWIYANPKFRRMYLRALKEMAGSVMQANSVEPVIDARQEAFLASSVNVPAGNVTTLKNWIRDARNLILTEVAREDATAFALTGSNTIETTNNLVTISGVAPVEMHSLRVNGIAYNLTFSSVRNWSIRIAVTDPSTVLNLQGYDIWGRPLNDFNIAVTVNYAGPTPVALDTVMFNEIMYNPLAPEASFIELFNRSSVFSFDLSGWRINGLGYTFPDGATLSPGEYLVLAKNSASFATAYGASIPIFGNFEGQLDDGGETLTLTRPGPNPGQQIVVDKVKYEDDPPWPQTPDGNGPSLQVLDAQQDNARVSNWSDGAGWRFYSYTAPAGSGASTLRLFLNTAGTIHLDDAYLTLGSTPESGPNLLQNPSFETGMSPWTAVLNHITSAVSSEVARTGANSLKIVSTGIGGNGGSIAQNTPGINATNIYTLSFWYLPTTNATTLGMRWTSNFRTDIAGNPHINVRPVLASPGGPNALTSILPAFPSLWLNEVQAVNVGGVTDNAGEAEPWIELYNASGSVIDLSGYYLANNFSNLTQWAFPAGSSINPGEYKLVWADTETSEGSTTHLHTSFGLSAPAGAVTLSRLLGGQPQIVDYLDYSGQQAGRSYGDFPDGQLFDRQRFLQPTPGAANIARDVDVYINEWMAANASIIHDPADQAFEDWIELYNADTNPVDLSGFYLSDNTNNPTQFRIPNGTIIPGGGYLLVWTDGETEQTDTNLMQIHASFNLARGGESIGLYGPNGATIIDEITFGSQTNDISQGRYPNGGPAPFYYMTDPTPGAANVIDGGGDNNSPTMLSISDKHVIIGETLVFAVTANDPDPGQSLTYSLTGAPLGASIGNANGIFQWAPTPAQGPSVNTFTVNATDNGVPALTASQSVTVHVLAPPAVRISRNAGDVSLAFPTLAGRSYQVQYKNQLSETNWINLGPVRLASGSSLEIPDTIGAQSQRFYRILLIPQE